MWKDFVSLEGSHDAEDEHIAIREFLFDVQNSPDFKERIAHMRGSASRFSNPRLAVDLAGVALDNPLIVGAGWDKIAHAVRALYELGFGAIEVGSVMEREQPGNPKPRHFILKPGVPMNAYGFNSPGVEVTAQNLAAYEGMHIPIGINIGKNKDVSEEKTPETYAAVARHLYAAGSYFVINVSSPNTPGLRNLQDKKPLADIVRAVRGETKEKPLFVKIAPDMTLDAVDDVIEIVLDAKLAGIVATNTTSSPEIKAKYGEQWRNEKGGVSGDDDEFRKMATDIIKHIYKNAGKHTTIIGVGGVKDAETALEKIRAGASAVQIVAALDEEGPTLPERIQRGILAVLEKEGVAHIDELVGVDAV